MKTWRFGNLKTRKLENNKIIKLEKLTNINMCNSKN